MSSTIEEALKLLEDRVKDMEIMLSSMSNNVEQLKHCKHDWVVVQEATTVMDHIWSDSRVCSKCGLRYRTVENCEIFN